MLPKVCSSTKFLHMDTVNNGWDNTTLHEYICTFAAGGVIYKKSFYPPTKTKQINRLLLTFTYFWLTFFMGYQIYAKSKNIAVTLIFWRLIDKNFSIIAYGVKLGLFCGSSHRVLCSHNDRQILDSILCSCNDSMWGRPLS